MRDETWYRDRLRIADVPEHMHDGYILYLLHGIEPGDFLVAVLSNDLREAVSRADEENARALVQHVRFLYNSAPMNCWGSREHVCEWIDTHRAATKGGKP